MPIQIENIKRYECGNYLVEISSSGIRDSIICDKDDVVDWHWTTHNEWDYTIQRSKDFGYETPKELVNAIDKLLITANFTDYFAPKRGTVQIIVPDEEYKQKILDASEKLHYEYDIDTDHSGMNFLAHIFMNPDLIIVKS